ncbi:MAG: hypothetical protein F6K04_02455 [Leptolyngbya sp. SIO4C5]|nr:hypothetical protein [Leptolyngbya sp. SIO4C5]
MTHLPFNSFLVGCIGSLAPEIIRLYKLRLNPTLRWSWGYLLFSIPFVLLGGFMAHILEPTTSYAAFYTGVSTPFIVTALAKDSEREAGAIQRLTRDKQQLEAELYHLQQSSPTAEPNTAQSEPQPGSSTSIDNGASHSGLRGPNLVPIVMYPSVAKNTTKRYFPQSPSRRFHQRLFKWRIVQSFLNAL